jgi:hypothetical protein
MANVQTIQRTNVTNSFEAYKIAVDLGLVPTGMTKSETDYERCTMVSPRQVSYYDIHHYDCESYGAEGYLGKVQKNEAEYVIDAGTGVYVLTSSL